MVGPRNLTYADLHKFLDWRDEMAKIINYQLRLKVKLNRPDAGAGKRMSASYFPPTPPSTPTAVATAGSIWTLSFGSPTSPPPTTSVSTALRVQRALAVRHIWVADGVLAAR